MRKKILVILCAVVLVATLMTVFASVVYIRSNDVGPYQIAAPTQTAIVLVGAPLPGSYDTGTLITLTATLGADANGRTVNFYDQNNVLVGSGVVAAGVAATTTIPQAGAWTYHALIV